MRNKSQYPPAATGKQIVFTVTNDLNYDQRMIRICRTLTQQGYQVTLVGRRQPNSLPLVSQPFRQHRLPGMYSKGKLFYVEFNLRLLYFLLRQRADIICAIDLDTILPCYLASVVKGTQRVYDAHELFCEMKEIVERPVIYRAWKWLERKMVPRFPIGYTVNLPIAREFQRMYGVNYEVIRNVPVPDPLPPVPESEKKEKFLIYQGAVNEGRSFETLIPAMQHVNAPLIICGEGNFMQQARKLVTQYQLQDKIVFKGKMLPEALKQLTRQAWAGITLFDTRGLSNYYSLANRFFDYIQAGIPQLCVDFPVYRELNNLYDVAVLCEDLSPETIARQLNILLENAATYRTLSANCQEARKVLHWGEEEKKLIAFYSNHCSNF